MTTQRRSRSHKIATIRATASSAATWDRTKREHRREYLDRIDRSVAAALGSGSESGVYLLVHQARAREGVQSRLTRAEVRTVVGAALTAGVAPADDAWRHIAQVAGVVAGVGIPTSDTLASAYRLAARRAHPDTGGTAEAFARLSAAKAMVERSIGEAA